MIDNFVISLIASAVVALIYGLFFAQKEERIRAFLKQKSDGWIKRRYVKAFVGAVRGEAVAGDTYLIAYLWLLVIFVAATFASYFEAEVEKAHVANNKNISALEKRLDAIFMPQKDLSVEEEMLEIKSQIKDTKVHVADVDSSLVYLLIHYHVISMFLSILLFLGILFWHPYLVMRQRFSFEMQRFTLRIQGLASKAELAELAVAESQVVDEKTLRKFVETTRAVADRHNVSELVSTFDLWRVQGN